MKYNIYDVRMNKNTHNFNGEEIVIDGEIGYMTFPGKWDIGEAKRHYFNGLPWNVPLKNPATYIINLSGKYYALAADTFMSTIYAIGQDVQEGKENAVFYTGDVCKRNEAIKQVAIPHDWKTAREMAEECGHYVGQLYSYEKGENLP